MTPDLHLSWFATVGCINDASCQPQHALLDRAQRVEINVPHTRSFADSADLARNVRALQFEECLFDNFAEGGVNVERASGHLVDGQAKPHAEHELLNQQ